ncbi:hypothetical protein [Streptomyces lydicus]|uniref:hypothetical protein n=1 Tax=Streptomyces lydicus TaxID=47763 RepID=UPI0037B40DCB
MHTTAGPALALLVVALIVRRQLRTRPVRATAPLIGTAVLGVLGVTALAFGVASATKNHPTVQGLLVRRRAARLTGEPAGTAPGTAPGTAAGAAA